MKTVYYLNLKKPWRQIVTVECEVVQCKAFAWAKDQFGARRLLGSSTFFTLAAAERSRIGELQRLAQSKVASAAPTVYRAAVAELKRYSGTMSKARHG